MDGISVLINYIAVVYIVLPILFLLSVLAYYIAGRRIAATAWATIIDFGKWYMLSVAVVFLGKMIETGFTERETGIKEIAIFDKYTNIALRTDSIDFAWALARYYSIVTPTERLRSRWALLRDTLQPGYLQTIVLRNKKAAFEESSLPPEVKKDSIASVEKSIVAIKQSTLLSVASNSAAIPTASSADFNAAKDWETKGFQALLDKDLNAAIINFNNSEQSYNGYHMVYEIWKYLRNYRKVNASSIDWKEIYKNVLEICVKYKGTMPDDVKVNMESQL